MRAFQALIVRMENKLVFSAVVQWVCLIMLSETEWRPRLVVVSWENLPNLTPHPPSPGCRRVPQEDGQNTINSSGWHVMFEEIIWKTQLDLWRTVEGLR